MGLICTITVLHSYAQINTSAEQKIDKQELKNEMLSLWIDNAVWTRQSILCLTDKLPGTQESLYRLLINQENMGRTFTKYYGKTAGDEFCELISSNTSLTIRIIREKSIRSTNELDQIEKRMVYNVKKTAAYLANINPNWDKAVLEKLFLLQLELFEKQVEARLSGNYEKDIAVMDKIISESYYLADVLSEGIIKQFPERFNL